MKTEAAFKQLLRQLLANKKQRDEFIKKSGYNTKMIRNWRKRLIEKKHIADGKIHEILIKAGWTVTPADCQPPKKDEEI